MRVKNSKLVVIASILLGAVLISPGCMLMHFVGDHHGDHHSGMMGHGTKNHGGEKDTEHRVGASQQTGPLDKMTRTESQGGLKVEIQFTEVTEKGGLAFAVRISDHVIGLSQYPLGKGATLSNDHGTQVHPSNWLGTILSPQYLIGTLYFPPKDASGRPLLAHGVRNVTLRIKDEAGISELIFQWNLSSSH
jgi:hypothetical protein